MRKILVRFILDDAWMWQSADGIPSIGIGYLLIPWVLYGVWWLRNAAKSGENVTELLYPLSVWLGLPLLAFILPRINPDIAPDGVPVFGYGFMIVVGLVCGAWFATIRARAVGLGEEVVWDVCMWLFLPGIIGARLFYLTQYYDRVFGSARGPGEWLFAAINLSNGGLVFYGGLICGIGGFLAFCFHRKISPFLMADVAAPSLFVGLGFGRIGCFLYGCCYGDRCDLPWAVTFPEDSMTYHALVIRGFLEPTATETFALHPTQIYSSINAFVLATLLAVYFRTRPYDGAVTAVAWIVYPVTRFTLEILRGDEMGQFNTSLTISQWISIMLFTTGIVYTLVLHQWRRSSGVPSPAPT